MKFYFVFICAVLGFLELRAAKKTEPGSFAGLALITISGAVNDEKGSPIPGVTIRLKGSSIVTQSDGNGKFKLALPELKGALVFSYTGYLSKEIPLSSALIYHVKLFPDLKALDEVVVIGYGTSTKRDLTGAVSQVKMEDLQKAPVASFEEALAGRVAGVQVSSSDGQPGAGLQISIRGNNSVTQSNSPLYVIDGFPLEDPANNVLNPAEIESIDILKDASATAIYGARGANGVIIVTTKKGKIGTPTIAYSNYFGFQKNLKKQEMLSAYEFVKYQLEFNPS
eukprot:gene20650-24543_t